MGFAQSPNCNLSRVSASKILHRERVKGAFCTSINWDSIRKMAYWMKDQIKNSCLTSTIITQINAAYSQGPNRYKLPPTLLSGKRVVLWNFHAIR